MEKIKITEKCSTCCRSANFKYGASKCDLGLTTRDRCQRWELGATIPFWKGVKLRIKQLIDMW